MSSQQNAVVVFSDGRRLPVAASTVEEAKRKAYRVERQMTIVDVQLQAA